MKTIEVGGDAIELTTDIFGLFGDRKSAVIDSGTTLAYLTPEVFEPFMKKVATEALEVPFIWILLSK